MKNAHGGDTYGREEMLDFSANINPLGMPESVRKAAADALGRCGGYPDPHCRMLVKKLAEHEGFDEANIVCGNGAADLIYRMIHAIKPKRAVITKPTFSEYAKALGEAGCEITECPTDAVEGAVTAKTDMVVMCSPNNPTGQLADKHTLEKLSGKCSDNNIILLCDECFIDLCEAPGKHSVRNYMNGNVIILKAFTKTYAMAGLRLGYALFGSPELADKVRETGQFWSVSAVAQAGGIAALDETEYVEKARRTIAEERRFLFDSLSRSGFTVYPSDANFILFKCGYPLDELLENEGFIIRNCGNYSGLGKGYFRIAVRLHKENEALMNAIEKVIKWQKT